MRTLLLHVGVLACLALAGCATPAARIRRNPALFASFPEAAQDQIRQGRIDLGFTTDMVRMALGSPDRTYRRTTREAESLVWAYVAYDISHDASWPHTVIVVKDHRGRTASRRIVNAPRRHRKDDREYEALRVEFSDGHVTAIERARH